MRSGQLAVMATSGLIVAVLGYVVASSVIERERHREAMEVASATIEIAKVESRVGAASGTAPPNQVQERVSINVPERVVRKAPFEVDVLFQIEDKFFFAGQTRRAQLRLSAGQRPVAKTSCPGVSSDGILACVQAQGSTKELHTGWIVQAADEDRLGIILELTQADGVNVANFSDLGMDEQLRLLADELATLTVTSGDDIVSVTKDDRSAESGILKVDFEHQRVEITSIPVTNPFGLTTTEQMMFQWGFTLLTFVLGNGIAWRFFRSPTQAKEA